MVCQQTNKANRKMPPRRTRLKIPGMCAEDPPSYSELETNDRDRLRREAALAQVSQDATYCVHYSSLREILNSQDLADRIARDPEGDLTHIEYLHQVPVDTPQDPRNLWLRKQDPTTGAVTVSNAAEDPWDLDIILFLPDGASPVDPGPWLLDIYAAMGIGHRAQDRDLSDEEALDLRSRKTKPLEEADDGERMMDARLTHNPGRSTMLAIMANAALAAAPSPSGDEEGPARQGTFPVTETRR